MSRSEAETFAIGRELGSELAPSGTLLLSGTLGAGKTVLAKGVAAALDIDPSQVQSPTFTLMREHTGSHASLLHVDLYRLDPEEVAAAGVEEALAGPGVKVVEWAERLEFQLPDAVAVRLTVDADGRRIIEEFRPNDHGPLRGSGR